jgi:hypothetical protein
MLIDLQDAAEARVRGMVARRRALINLEAPGDA